MRSLAVAKDRKDDRLAAREGSEACIDQTQVHKTSARPFDDGDVKRPRLKRATMRSSHLNWRQKRVM